jgi:serine/threonine protein kinase
VTSDSILESTAVLLKNKRVSSSRINSLEFFVACMLLCLEYLHKNCILHRDIKPENLVFDENGYLRITDLGIARVWNPENAKDTSGTPGYMAPEVMCR